MGQALRNPRYFTVEEYLAHEQQVGERQEFVNGVIYAMVGGSRRHNRLTGNVAFSLRRQLGVSCETYEQGQKLRIETDLGSAFYYPDVMSVCDPSDDHASYVGRPCLIVEVLSPSTESGDRQGKFQLYRTLPSLLYYILVAHDVPQIEVFSRSNAWKPEIVFRGDAIEVCASKALLTVDDIYLGIDFSS